MDKTFRDYIRMCRTVEGCYGCPMWEECGGESCVDWMYDHPNHAEEIIRKWAEKHPETTYKSYLMERFPKADMRHCCVAVLFGESERLNNCKDMCVRDCDGCWNRPIKEG